MPVGECHRRSDPWVLPQVLIITVDSGVRALATHLQESAFRVTFASQVLGMEEFINTGQVDLLVLDMMLPDHDGLDLCRRLRAHGNDVPLIMFSGRGREQDKVLGLEAGADDYLTQPFGGRELVARLRALLRRCRISPPTRPATELAHPAHDATSRRGVLL